MSLDVGFSERPEMVCVTKRFSALQLQQTHGGRSALRPVKGQPTRGKATAPHSCDPGQENPRPVLICNKNGLQSHVSSV